MKHAKIIKLCGDVILWSYPTWLIFVAVFYPLACIIDILNALLDGLIETCKEVRYSFSASPFKRSEYKHKLLRHKRRKDYR